MAREKLCVGIDIGASSIKLCQLKSTKDEISLEHFGLVPLPNETIVDGALMNAPRVVEAIQELIASHKVRTKQVALSVSGHSVIIKKIPLPQMTPEELRESIQWEAEQYIPFDIQDVFLDVQIVNPEAAQQGQMEVVLVAAKKDMINEYMAVLHEAGLDPVICDVDAFAMETMFEKNYDNPPESTIALINLGATKTTLNIISKGVSCFTRDLNIGGNAFTEEIQRQASVGFDEAEDLKLSYNGENTNDAAEAAIELVSDSYTNEILRSIDFYSATSADGAPTKIYLGGGSARLARLVQAIAAGTGVETEVINPFRKITTNPEDQEYLTNAAPTASVVVGLALRYLGDN